MGDDSPPPAPPPPDYSGVANASKESAELAYKLGGEQLAWAREQHAQDKATSDRVVNAALATMDKNNAAADKDRARYEAKYQPLEDQYIQQSRDWASPERKRAEMGAAQAEVANQFEAQRKNVQQNLEGFGIDPSSTRYAALDTGVRVARAAAQAGAGNTASQQLDREQLGLEANAINVGRGYPGQVTNQFNTGTNAGNSAVNNALATTASGANTMGTATQWQGLGNQSQGNWVGALNGQANANNNFAMAQNAAAGGGSGWGSALGLVGSLGSAAIMRFAEGGTVDEMTPGGAIPSRASPSGGDVVDDVPARLTAGEFVVPKDVVQWKGEEFFQKLIMGSRKKAQTEAPAQPQVSAAAPEDPTFVSRPGGGIPGR